MYRVATLKCFEIGIDLYRAADSYVVKYGYKGVYDKTVLACV